MSHAAKRTLDQTGDVRIEVGGLRAELRPRPRDDRRGGSMAGTGRDDAEGTALACLRGGGGNVMISARGQFHSGGGPPSAGSEVDGAGAEVGGTTAALSPAALEDGPPPVAPQTA